MALFNIKYFGLLLLLTQFTFAQTENTIYNAIDNFVASPTFFNLEKLTFLEKKLSIQAKSKPELLALVILNCNKGYYENQFGNSNQAIKTYEKSWRIFQNNKLKNYDIIEFCLKPLGNLYTKIGDYDSAENTIKQYYFIANQTENKNQKIAAILNLAIVYQSSGRREASTNLIIKSIKEEKLTTIEKSLLLNNLATNYILNQEFEKAKTVILKLILNLKNVRNQEIMLSNAHRNLASIYLNKNDLNSARIQFNLGEKYLFESKAASFRDLLKCSLEEVHLLLKEKNYSKCEKKINLILQQLLPNFDPKKQSFPNKNILYGETTLLDVFDALAEVKTSQKLYEEAIKTYELSFHVQELLQTQLVYENSKIINQIETRVRTEKCLNIYQLLFKKTKNKQFIENAFLLSEKSKSAVLNASMEVNSKISMAQNKTIEKLQTATNAIILEQQKQENANVFKINKYIVEQNKSMLALKELQIEDKNYYVENLKTADLFEKLSLDKANLVSYFAGENFLYCFKVIDNEIEMLILEKNNKIDIFLNYFTNSDAISDDISGFSKASFNLFQYLKLEFISKRKNLIIIPDGKLNFFPFEALLTEESKSKNFSQLPYFIKKFEVSYNNSISFYLKNTKKNQSKTNVFGVFPIFKNSIESLPYSQTELKAIQGNFKGVFLENNNATFSNFQKSSNQFNILHLSTHASSGDVFEPATIRFYDKEVLYTELYNLNINPDLVVLSACETGIGKWYKGEGSMSVARGFQFAGAQNLLFSLWKVNDFTTSKLMTNFYANLKKHKAFSENIHKAKLDFLADTSISNLKKSPYYWAPFVYYGSIQAENNNYWICSGLFLCFLGLLYLVFKIKKFN